MTTDYFEDLENPFLIEVGDDQREYGADDYAEVQRKLRELNLDAFLESLYPRHGISVSPAQMLMRCKKGVTQTLVAGDAAPKKELFKIGSGGDGASCFVNCTQATGDRSEYAKDIRTSLEEVGFNGHLLLLNGGFPNPTGREMKYAGVPYVFKIFMMLEAKNAGFKKVIWIDAACRAINNPEALFATLDETDLVCRMFEPNTFQPNTCENVVLPKTIDLLSALVGRDIRNDVHINSIVFGLNLESPVADKFVGEYYEMARLGLPFLSAFPEEIVFASILNKPDFAHLLDRRHGMMHLYVHEVDVGYDVDYARRCGFYFLQRAYR